MFVHPLMKHNICEETGEDKITFKKLELCRVGFQRPPAQFQGENHIFEEAFTVLFFSLFLVINKVTGSSQKIDFSHKNNFHPLPIFWGLSFESDKSLIHVFYTHCAIESLVSINS